jgi:hypothetical protein
MIKMRFYWGDLNKQAQRRITKLFGNNCNWDCIPFCVLDIEDEEKNATFDSFLGDKDYYDEKDD